MGMVRTIKSEIRAKLILCFLAYIIASIIQTRNTLAYNQDINKILQTQKTLQSSENTKAIREKKTEQYINIIKNNFNKIVQSAYYELKAKGVEFDDADKYVKNAQQCLVRMNAKGECYYVYKKLDSNKLIIVSYSFAVLDNLYSEKYICFAPMGLGTLYALHITSTDTLLDPNGNINKSCRCTVKSGMDQDGMDQKIEEIGKWSCADMLSGKWGVKVKDAIIGNLLKTMNEKQTKPSSPILQ